MNTSTQQIRFRIAEPTRESSANNHNDKSVTKKQQHVSDIEYGNSADEDSVTITELWTKVQRGRPPKKSGAEDAVQMTVQQSRYLVYGTIKTMFRNYGSVLPKGAKIPKVMWSAIAKELNEMPGLSRGPKQWARCFTGKKHFIGLKFRSLIEAHKDDSNFQPDWSTFSILDILMLQDYRQDYPSMPSVPDLLHHVQLYNALESTENIMYTNNIDVTATMSEIPMQIENAISSQSRKSSYKETEEVCSESMEECDRDDDDAVSNSSMPQDVNTSMQDNVIDSSLSRQVRYNLQKPHLTLLGYLAVKHLVHAHGSDYRKNCRLNLRTWSQISSEMLVKTGKQKNPKKWRKTYAANKYCVQTRFVKRMQLEVAGDVNHCTDWSKVRVEELLYLPSLRWEGFPDMPKPELIMKAYERNHKFINFNDDYMHATNNSWHSTVYEVFDLDPIQVKSEPFSEYSETETNGYQETIVKEEPKDLPQVSQNPHPENTQNAVSNSDRQDNRQNSVPIESRKSIESQHDMPQNTAPHPDSHEHYYLERRLLEINEQILREKVKKNKILRKKNKILKGHTKMFGKLLTKLDSLIEKKFA